MVCTTALERGAVAASLPWPPLAADADEWMSLNLRKRRAGDMQRDIQRPHALLRHTYGMDTGSGIKFMPAPATETRATGAQLPALCVDSGFRGSAVTDEARNPRCV
jgi:hypothetical protein